ncbi:GNAT family N-acetyltransferase [Kocuria rosea]|uniref:GNAT family N-acetyltransferase n=1 Tax=Kocuria rosea TaxID=1275 RepID=UPI0035A63676
MASTADWSIEPRTSRSCSKAAEPQMISPPGGVESSRTRATGAERPGRTSCSTSTATVEGKDGAGAAGAMGGLLTSGVIVTTLTDTESQVKGLSLSVVVRRAVPGRSGRILAGDDRRAAPETERLAFRRFDGADLEPMHSYQSARTTRSTRGGARARARSASAPWPRTAACGRGAGTATPSASPSPPGLTGARGRDRADPHGRGGRAGRDRLGGPPRPRGPGHRSEAARAAIEFAFAELGAHRVCASLDALNVSSAKVCERIGMRLEATLRESHRQLGEWRDELIYAILADEA